jgi:hypothetical protein
MPDQILADMTVEIRANNISKGHRPADGGPGTNTWGDYIALLHSEVSEALEAYRDHRLADTTVDHYDRIHGFCAHGELRGGCSIAPLSKPEGVGSELADVLIRFLDMCDVFGLTPFDMDCGLADVESVDPPARIESFGDLLAWLHGLIAAMIPPELEKEREFSVALPAFLRGLVTVAEIHRIDLTAEYTRKIAYDKTRAFQHGGRTLADHS